MRETDILIVGGGIAGTTAAEPCRAGDSDATITIVSEEKHPLYSRVLLPHAVLGKIPDARVYLKDDAFYHDSGIVYLAGARIADVDPAEKVATCGDGSTIRFGKLVIATGARPRTWTVPGADLDGVLQLQTYDDIAPIRESLAEKGDMVIVGAGFIAMEFAAFAVDAGLKATLLNRGAHFCASVFGETMGREVQGLLEAKGITVLNDVRVERVTGERAVEGVRLADGREIPCRSVALGIGLEIDTAPFAKIGTSSGVLADGTLKTAHDGIWVAGDCCEFEDPLLGFRHVTGNWTNAMMQGRHVGRALLGESAAYVQLTAHASMCFPGAAIVYLGETRGKDGIEREAKVLASGRAVELHRKDSRLVGAVLLNAAEYRASLSKAIMARSDGTLDTLLG